MSTKHKPLEKPRNLLHDHPLLRKGAAHGKSRKSQRRAAKVDLRREWYQQSALPQSTVPMPPDRLGV